TSSLLLSTHLLTLSCHSPSLQARIAMLFATAHPGTFRIASSSEITSLIYRKISTTSRLLLLAIPGVAKPLLSGNQLGSKPFRLNSPGNAGLVNGTTSGCQSSVVKVTTGAVRGKDEGTRMPNLKEPVRYGPVRGKKTPGQCEESLGSMVR